MTMPRWPDQTLELPRSQPTAIDPWADLGYEPPGAWRPRAAAAPPLPAPVPPAPLPPAPRYPAPRHPAPLGVPPRARKHVASAYALWLLFGAFGVHRFYLDRTVSGVVYLLLFVLSPLTLFLSLPVLGVCLVVDLFRLPGLTRRANVRRGWGR